MDGSDDGGGRCNDDGRMCGCGGSTGAVVRGSGALVWWVLRAIASVLLLRERWGKTWEACNGEYDRTFESVAAWCHRQRKGCWRCQFDDGISANAVATGARILVLAWQYYEAFREYPRKISMRKK